VQDLNCGQMSVSGRIVHYEFVLGAGAKAKTVTNKLPLLSVLAIGLFFFDLIFKVFEWY
jgi:Cys-tRNA synthase (O-phospho-L-seryl-tRNA:Cys-tRNA synthase)